MFSSKPKFNPDKCKVQLKMLISRIKLQLSKQTNLAKAERRVVAGLLRDDKEHQARIKVEQIIRADFKLESLELINNYTELLISRFSVLVAEPQMKPEIAEAVTALVYAGYLLGNELPELKELFNMFTAKYGTEYTQQVITNKDKYLAHRFNKVLTSSQVPDATVVVAYLQEIAKSYGVEYVPTLSAQPPAHISATTGLVLPDPGLTNFKITLTKRHPEGFGLTLDSDNVVTALKNDDARRKVAIGDRCIAFNDIEVTREKPVKMVAIDCSEGQEATFTMSRTPVAAEPLPPVPSCGPVPAGAPVESSGSASTGGLYDARSLGGLPPEMVSPQDAPPPAVPSLPEAPSPRDALPSAPGGGPLPSTPALEEDADDLLAKRLAALKR